MAGYRKPKQASPPPRPRQTRAAKPSTKVAQETPTPSKAPIPKAVPNTARKELKHMSVGSSWKKVAGAAPWVGGQSSHLTPGSEGAIGRRKNSAKFKARGKKVIRPRITKHPHRKPDTP